MKFCENFVWSLIKFLINFTNYVKNVVKFFGNQNRNFKKFYKSFDEILWETEKTFEKKKKLATYGNVFKWKTVDTD